MNLQELFCGFEFDFSDIWDVYTHISAITQQNTNT